jgi:hypothetical protein
MHVGVETKTFIVKFIDYYYSCEWNYLIEKYPQLEELLNTIQSEGFMNTRHLDLLDLDYGAVLEVSWD